MIRQRSKGPLESTESLLNLITSVFPHDQYKIAAQVFQSLRMVVNNEMFEIWAGLKGASDLIQNDGVILGKVNIQE